MNVNDEQVDQAFQAGFGIPAREADKLIVKELGGTTEVLAEYMWDHWMGEPESPTAAEVQAAIEKVIS